MNRVGIAAALIIGAAGVWATGCQDGAGIGDPTPPPPDGPAILSDPVASASLTGSVSAGPRATSTGTAVAYVSLPPHTVPGGAAAVVRNRRTGNTTAAAVIDGGFDPVPVPAIAGDTVDITVQLGGGSTWVFYQPVPLKHSPAVVRTYPSSGRRDVPLNTTIVVVFSEPINASTLTPSSVQLFRGTTPIAGTVSLLQGSATAAVFTPSATLDTNTDYRLVVTQGVRDMTGDALAADATVQFRTGTTSVGQAYTVSVAPDTTALPIGSQVQLIAVASDSLGEPVSGRPVVWSSDTPALATVSATGLVTALARGEARVRALVDGPSGVAVILVATALARVDSVEVRPEFATVVIDGVVQLTAVLRDAAGNILQFRPVTWETSAPAVVGVSGGSGGKALVTGVSAGSATITATSEGTSGTARITVGTVGPFTQISAGGCALTADGAAWCWGDNGAAQLGNGTVLSSPAPTAVAGSLRFSRISGSCALTVDSTAYCWGTNWYGALGSGTAVGPEVCPNHGQCSTTPVAVVGGLRFSAIDRGVLLPFTCALAQSGDAYCWGNNEAYQLGVGTGTGPEYCPDGSLLTGRFSCSTVPAKVAGGFTFTSITAGRGHACALTGSGAAYCWGSNYAGQLGDGTTSDRTSPVPVVGGHAFAAIAAGYDHTCAVTSDGSAYCWGSTGGISSWVPVPVAGTLTFAAISAGVHRTCALTSGGLAYCWGATPVAVAGGLVFATLDAGADVYANDVACGVTRSGVAYCWDGSNVPVKVPGQP